jgi:hypothetical protein
VVRLVQLAIVWVCAVSMQAAQARDETMGERDESGP